MTIWIINPYGTIPGEGWSDYRSTMIANALNEAGHTVVWWVSNFEHRAKRFRSAGWEDRRIGPRYLVRFVPSTTYSAHISLARIRYELEFARQLHSRALTCEPPDVIIIAEPALFISAQVLDLVRRWRVKLVVDIIDLWPELFHMILPRALSWTGHVLFAPLYAKRKALLAKADAVVAVSHDYLALAQRLAPHRRADVIYWGTDVSKLQSIIAGSAHVPDQVRLAPKREGEVWAIYAGTLGENYDIKTILKAAQQLTRDNAPVRCLIAGDGPLKQYVIETIQRLRLRSVVYLGSIRADILASLYAHCDIALSTYIERSTVAMPIKFFDYVAAGLPIVNSLKREVGDIIRSESIGAQYRAGDFRSLANSVRDLANDKNARAQMRHNALAIAGRFDCREQHAKFVAIVNSL